MMHIADNQDALLDYLYEEGDSAERVAIATHLQECTRCSVAVLEFQTVRGMLGAWTPPASQRGFRIVQDANGWGPTTAKEKTATVGWAWAQAAAAVLLFAAGVAVSSRLHVEYGEGAVTVRMPSAPAGGSRNASIVLPAASQPEVGPAPATVTNVSASGVSETGDAMLQRMQAMIEQSELRQRRELARRLSEVASEVDLQHRADLVRIQQDLGQIEMETGAQIDQQRRQLNEYLVRTSGGAK